MVVPGGAVQWGLSSRVGMDSNSQALPMVCCPSMTCEGDETLSIGCSGMNDSDRFRGRA